MLHVGVPDDKKGDPETYAKWRIEHMDKEELAAMHHMPRDQILEILRAEWEEPREMAEANEIEGAEVVDAPSEYLREEDALREQ